jgi:hypothetical protein
MNIETPYVFYIHVLSCIPSVDYSRKIYIYIHKDGV